LELNGTLDNPDRRVWIDR